MKYEVGDWARRHSRRVNCCFILHTSHFILCFSLDFPDRRSRGVNPLKQLVPHSARRAPDFAAHAIMKLPQVVDHPVVAVRRAVEFEHQLPTQATILPPPNDPCFTVVFHSLCWRRCFDLPKDYYYTGKPKFGTSVHFPFSSFQRVRLFRQSL